MAEAYIVATARTAGGRKGGRLAGWTAPVLTPPRSKTLLWAA